MSDIKTRGIVIKQSDFGETNRILTIFTKEYGIIRTAVYGAKSIKNKNSAASQFLTYADFILRDTGKDLMSFNSADVIESFFPVKEDIEKLSLSVYFADLVYNLINQNVPDENILTLFLNCVYALGYRDIDCETVRAVFELRVMSYAGYRPNLNSCCFCAKEETPVAFSATGGGIVCKDCKKLSDIKIDVDVFNALRYIILCDEKKMFSFEASGEVLKKVSKISEIYVKTYTEKEFSSLNYYKTIKE